VGLAFSWLRTLPPDNDTGLGNWTKEHRNGHPLSVANLAAGKISWKSKTRQRSTANDRDGSSAEVDVLRGDVRVTLETRHRTRHGARVLRATSRTASK
jgi:hypothetical protein